jgi:xylulokinase
MSTKVIHAGKANLFLSPIFRRTLATLCDTTIEILSTDGALGAARGAALGCGFYKDSKEAFANLQKEGEVTPVEEWKQPLEDAYGNWKEYLNKTLQ